jgi:hypothetical protein
MRMIQHEARTGTIRYFTGLSDDRIRKLYTSYFKYDGRLSVKRHRGKSPTQIAPLVQTPDRALESGVFVSLLRANGLIGSNGAADPELQGNIDLGHRFCQCYETHCIVVPDPLLTFEWGWNLLLGIRRGDELGVARCDLCSMSYVYDLLALPRCACPACASLRVEQYGGRRASSMI